MSLLYSLSATWWKIGTAGSAILIAVSSNVIRVPAADSGVLGSRLQGASGISQYCGLGRAIGDVETT
jgi:hypothetical protein